MKAIKYKRIANPGGVQGLGGSGGVGPVYVDLDPVISQTNTPQPDVAGDRYLVGSAGTGIWATKSNQVAEGTGAGYTYTVPTLNDYVYITSTLQTLRYTGTAWVPAPARAILQNGNNFGTAGVRIGTNNAQSTTLLTNNTTRLQIDSTGRVKIGTGVINSSAQFQVDSTTRGILIPTMTTAQKNAIGTPATSLLVFDSTLNLFQYYDGASWMNLIPFTTDQYDAVTNSSTPTGVNPFATIADIPAATTPNLNTVLTEGNTSNLPLYSTNSKSRMSFDGISTITEFTDGAITGSTGIDSTQSYITWTDGTNIGSLINNTTKSELSHTDLISISAPIIDIPTIQTGDAGLTTGQLYVDTAANILANGDLILARKV